MSDLRVRLLLEAEAAAARQALQGTVDDLQKMGDAAQQAAARGVAAGVALDRSNAAVAGSAAQVGYQFNDIAMMWAAGQSPFMTAIQQGTQLNQILGAQGVRGAAEIAKSALATMFNPFSIGLIAALTLGGTFVQWLVDVGEETKSVEERTKELTDATKAYADAAKAAEEPIESLRAKYGDLADEVKRALESQREEAAYRATQAVGDLLTGDVLNVDGFQAQIERLDEAQARLDAMKAELAGLQATPGADPGRIEDLQRQILFQTAAVEEQRIAVAGLEAAYGRTAQQARALSAAADDFRNAQGPGEMAAAADRLRTVLIEVYGTQARANEATGGMVTALDAAVRAGAEQQRTAAATSDILAGTVGIVGDIKAALDGAAEGAGRVAGVDIAGNIGAALGPAAALAARLWDAANAAVAAANARRDASLNYGKLQNEYGSGPDAARSTVWHLNAPTPPTPGSGAAGPSSQTAGGGGGAAPRDGLAALRAEAADTLREMDVAVAAIGERLRAGLIDAGEAADGVSAAKERAANALAELIARLEALGPAGQAAAAQLRGSLADVVPAANRLSETLEGGFKGAFSDFIRGAAEAEDAFAAFASSIEQRLADLAADQVWDGLIAPLFSGFGTAGAAPAAAGAASGGGGILDFIGNLFGGAFATGGAPLSAMANTVVGRPTTFDMGGGKTGILGEDGDEAIMPLRGRGALAILPGGQEARLPLARGAGGDLGIVLPPDLVAAGQAAREAVAAFATGGAPPKAMLSAMANTVVSTPTFFAMGNGKTGLLAEEDDEAILPLRGKGALAILPGGQEARLPLARGAGGDLGIVLPPDLIAAVQPFARGGAPGRALASLAAELPSPRSAPAMATVAEGGGGFGGPRKVSVSINNSGEPMRAEAEVTETGEEISVEVMLDQIDNGLARRIMNRRGATAGAIQSVFGLGRSGR